MITQTFNLNLIPDSAPVVVRVNQYDKGTGRFVISLFDGDIPYTPAAGAEATIQGTKPDGKGFDYDASWSGNTVTANVTEQMTAAYGTVRCQIVITEGNNVTGTFVFNMEVQKSALPADTDMSASEYQVVQRLLDKAEAIANKAPTIGANGNWWAWSVEDDAYVDTGVDASITVRIADITMLAPDAQPYVTNSGTNTDPIFHLFIPRGKSISGIAKTSTSGLADTYTITYSDGATYTYVVTNGKGITSITKTSTSGLVDTYTIAYNDGDPTTFTVTNGKTAYQSAVEGGYQGTESEFYTDLANFKDIYDTIVANESNSEAWATGKRNGTDVGSSDETYHNNSKYYSGLASTSETNAANSASASAGSATASESSAEDSEAWAVGQRDGTDVASTDDTYHNNSKYYSEQSGASATASAGSATASESSAEDSEAWAVGQRDGTDVASTDDTYHNNSKYYSEQSGASATASAGSATASESSAEDSEAWAVGQRDGVDVPSTDDTYHNNAKYYSDHAATSETNAANSATASAGSATASESSAEDSEAWAVGQRDGTDVASTDDTYHNNSKYYSEQSGASATASAGSATASESSAEDSEAWAVGQRDGVDVASTDETYHNNAKYYSDHAATSETNAANSATASAGSASAADASATEAESWTKGGTNTRPGEDTNNARYWALAAEAAANLDFMENYRMGIGKPDTLTATASNGTFTALGVAIRSFINEEAAEFGSQWLMDANGNILTPDVRQLYRVVEDPEYGTSSLYYWTGTAYEIIGAGGSDISIGDVSGAAVTTFATTASLTWSDPSDVTIDGVTVATWGGTLLVRKAGSAPESKNDGVVVLNNTNRNAYSQTPFVDTGLTYGVTYYYKFFPYTSGRKYSLGSSVSVTPSRRAITTTPTISESLTYDGTEQTVTINNFDSDKMTKSGDSATLAGTHTATVTPKEGYCWSDQTYGSLSLSWTMNKASVTIPTTSDGFTYDGYSHEAITSTYDSSLITVTGTHNESEVGSYSFTMSLVDDDNYQWSDGTIADITKTWRIVAELLTVPTVTANLTYDGTEQGPTIGTYDNTKISVTGITGTNAGTYNAVFHIIDPSSYLWSDETSADKTVQWSIAPAQLMPPQVTANLTYDGTEKTATVSAYDNTKISVTGITGTNAGTYNATISLIDDDNYEWSDGTTADKTPSWTIAKAAGSVTLSSNNVVLDASTSSDTVTISSATGTVTGVASSDSTVCTASLSGNTITLSSVNDTNGSATITVSVAGSGNYEATTATIQVTCSFSSTYGAEWDGTSTTAWSRTDDAAGFTDPVPYVSGASSYGSPFDNIMPWSGMVKEERTGGTMVKIPKFWYKLTQNGAGMKIQISDSAQDGFSVSPAHMDRGDGKGERDYIYVGRYHCGSSDFKSSTGQTPKNQTTRSNFRTSIHSLGSDIWQLDFATRFTIWLLYIVEFADLNSQAKIGYGCGNNSAVQAMGYTDSMPYHTGTTQSSRTTYGLGTQYRYIEGLWDNVYDWIDGCYNSSSGLNIILNPANFSDSSGGTSIGTPSSGYPSAFSVTDVSGTFTAFIPSAANGSDSTYSCDSWNFSASYPCVFGGGYYYQSLSHGLFYVYWNGVSSAYASLGSRLMELP